MMGRGGIEISLRSFFKVGGGRSCSNRILQCGLVERHSSCIRGGMLVSPCDQNIRNGCYVLPVTQNGILKGKSEELKWSCLCTGIPKNAMPRHILPIRLFVHIALHPRLLLLTTCGDHSNFAPRDIYVFPSVITSQDETDSNAQFVYLHLAEIAASLSIVLYVYYRSGSLVSSKYTQE